MTYSLDCESINHATVAVENAMSPQLRRRKVNPNTLLFGGPSPTSDDLAELADFATRKNYHLIFVSFDADRPSAGPVGFSAVITDGEAETFVVENGRLWQQDRRSRAILLFSDGNALLKLSSKGKLVVREFRGPYHDQGFDYAREAVAARAARKPGMGCVISQVGDCVTVLDRWLQATALATA